MNKEDFKNLGREFKYMVRDFMNTADMNKINRDVRSTVSESLDKAFEEVRKAISSIQAEAQRTVGKSTAQVHPKYQQAETKQREATNQQATNQQTAKKQPQATAVGFPHKPVGRAAGVLYTVFGSIGIGFLGIAAAIVIPIVLDDPVALTRFITVLSIFFSASVALDIKGSVVRRRLKRYKRYVSLLNGRSSCMIRELSAYSGFSERFIIRDFRKMIELGMFPQAHIDDEKTLLMLNNESYDNYLAQQAEYKARKMEEKQKSAGQKKANGAGSSTHAKMNPEIKNAVEEGKKYIRLIHDAGMAIPDSEVSAKIARLEDTISKIIGYIEAHPEKLSEVRRLMAYYLPTTVNLLEAYKEFDRQPIQGENIQTAKKEINDALGNINLAFENLFDSFFENAAWNVSADISVLNTILKQEGLTDKDFKPKS